MVGYEMKTSFISFALVAISVLCVRASDDEGFRPLFNGKDTTGWHLRHPQGRNSWSVENGVLKNTVAKGQHGTDLVTDEKFWNFTVRYEYLVPDNSNSGFYLRGRHELQILGDHASGKASLGGNGAIYNFKAPDKFVSKPGNEWQTVEAVIVGNRVTVVLNGQTVQDNAVLEGITGGALDSDEGADGPIMLQGDHGKVWFRKVIVTPIVK